MKKVFALVVALLMMLGCALAEDSWLAGYWILDKAEYMGMTVDASTLGTSLTLELKNDHTLVMTADGDTGEGTWSVVNGQLILTSDEEEMSFVIGDNCLYVEKYGIKVYLAKEGSQTQTQATLVEVPAAQEAAFDPVGVWEFAKAESGTMSFDAATMGVTMTMTFEADGTMTITGDGMDEKGTWKMKDGKLMIDDGDMEMPCTVNGDSFSAEDDGVVMHFVRVTVGEEPAAVAAPAEEPDAAGVSSVAAFYGEWGNAYVVQEGIQVPLTAVGMTSGLKISAEQVLFEFNGTEVPLPVSYTDGVLYAASGETTLTIALEEADVAVLTTNGASFYYEKLN